MSSDPFCSRRPSAGNEKNCRSFREPLTCKEPIEVVSYKIGVCKVSPSGKACHTDFQRLSFSGRTSVVLCRPHTGRMHQIRVHLQYLGEFPPQVPAGSGGTSLVSRRHNGDDLMTI